jgi:subtilisin family serine protease
MLDLPRVPEHLQALSFTDPENAFEQAVWQLASTDEENQALALRGKCDRLMALGRQVVAAAGNDWKGKRSGSPVPATRFPGAFVSTFGVGALPKDSIPDPITNKWESSSYSNLADVPDDPNIKKIVTLGGEEGEEQGVLGLYLGEFPGCEPQPNCTKWAWWAGTSFATPIFTAAIAAVLSKTDGPEKTQDAVDLLFQPVTQPNQKVIVERNGTSSGEDVMEAGQVC